MRIIFWRSEITEISMTDAIDTFCDLMKQIAGKDIYGKLCQDFDQEELVYTQNILSDKYKLHTTLIDTLVGFFRETIIVIVERMGEFQCDTTEKFHHFLLLRATMLRAQAIRKLFTSGYNSEAIGLTRTLWEIFELQPAIRKNIVTLEEYLGGKTTQDDLLMEQPERRRKQKKKQNDFDSKLGNFRESILKNWLQEEKDHVIGWIQLMHSGVHRNQLEFSFSKNDLDGASLSISIRFEEKRVQTSLNIIIFTLCGLLKDLKNSLLFPSSDQKWFEKYSQITSLLSIFCQESPMKKAKSITKYINELTGTGL